MMKSAKLVWRSIRRQRWSDGSDIDTDAPRKSWNAALQDDFRSLVRQTSRLRDLDVLCARVRKTSGDAVASCLDGEQVTRADVGSAPAPTGPSLEALCLQMRAEERGRAVAALSGRRLHRAARRVRRPMEGVIWRTSVKRGGLDKEDLQELFTALDNAFRSAHEALDFSDASATHSLRKRAKRIRYVAEELGVLLDEGTEGTVRQMESIQDELGALCDARANRQTIASIDRGATPFECSL